MNKSDAQKKEISQSHFGEFVSLGVSVIVLIFMFGYLIWNIVDSSTELVNVTAQAMQEKALPIGDQYVMPVEVTNHSDRTVDILKVLVEVSNSQEEVTEYEVEMEYLTSHSTQKFYLYVEEPINQNDVIIKPIYYKLQ